MRRDQIAAQLYTVRRPAAADLAGTLRAVADAGFHSVEVAGLPELAPAELRRQLDEAGLRAISVHVGIDRLRADVATSAAAVVALDCPRLVVPWLPEEDRRSVGAVRAFASELTAIGRRLADLGLRFGYHNHDFEFRALDGTTIWDILLTELDTSVDLEIDVYWVSVGGRDPVEVIRGAGDRVKLLHMKDRAAGTRVADAPAGEGSLDFPAIVEAARAAGVEWYIVEQDEPADALGDLGAARRYLERLATA
jgi:sugar phosphate isomerase/epimerase